MTDYPQTVFTPSERMRGSREGNQIKVVASKIVDGEKKNQKVLRNLPDALTGDEKIS